MVGDDGGRDHVEFAGAPAIEDIGETVIRFGDQQHDPAPRRAVAHLPVHGKALRDRRKTGLQRRQLDREIGGREHHPHEELPGLDIVELLRIENVLAVLGQKRRDGGDDAGTIRTGQRQYELMVGHVIKSVIKFGQELDFSALLYQSPCPCANAGCPVRMNKCLVIPVRVNHG